MISFFFCVFLGNYKITSNMIRREILVTVGSYKWLESRWFFSLFAKSLRFTSLQIAMVSNIVLHTQMMHLYLFPLSHQINWNNESKQTKRNEMKQNKIALDIGTCKHLKFIHPSSNLSFGSGVCVLLCAFNTNGKHDIWPVIRENIERYWNPMQRWKKKISKDGERQSERARERKYARVRVV